MWPVSGQKWGVAVNVWWLQVIGVGGVRTEMGCYSYCVVLQVIRYVGGFRNGMLVIVWWLQIIGVGGVRTEIGCYSYCVVLQVIDVGGVRTEMWLLQLLCGG